MIPSDDIKPVNIITAAFLMQFCLIIIMFTGVRIIKGIAKYIRAYNSYPVTTLNFAWRILPFALVTMGLLIFSQDFLGLWAPLFPGVTLPSLTSSDTVLIVIGFNILFVCYMIYSSGGSQASPFSPILFTLPTLSIFLRVPFRAVLFFVILVIISFSFTYSMFTRPQEKTDQFNTYFSRAYYANTVMCLLLTTLIAYVTRRF